MTIATVIGRSRMKGERIVTNLLPYGPEKPRLGLNLKMLLSYILLYLELEYI